MIKQIRAKHEPNGRQALTYVEMLASLNTQKVPIFLADRNQSECILEVDFAKKCIETKFVSNIVCVVYSAAS